MRTSVKPKRDTGAEHDAFREGQETFLKGKPLGNPDLDAHRLAQYRMGYAMEKVDWETRPKLS
jgi:hypothetical protein